MYQSIMVQKCQEQSRRTLINLVGELSSFLFAIYFHIIKTTF